MVKSILKGSLEKGIDGDRVYKFNHSGYEDIAEALVSELESYIKGFYYIDYYLDKMDGRPCCYSHNFRSEDKDEVTFCHVLSKSSKFREGKRKYSGKDLVKFIEDCIFDITELDVHLYLSNIMKLDSIILNEDRHLNNLTLWSTLEEGCFLMPVFDNGLSLLSCLKSYPMNLPIKELIKITEPRLFAKSYRKQLCYFSDSPPLKIDIEGFMSSLESNRRWLQSFLGVRYKYYVRAEEVLMVRLRELEGTVWIR